MSTKQISKKKIFFIGSIIGVFLFIIYILTLPGIPYTFQECMKSKIHFYLGGNSCVFAATNFKQDLQCDLLQDKHHYIPIEEKTYCQLYIVDNEIMKW